MEGARGQRNLLSLLDHSLEDLGVDVTLVASGVAAEEIKVLATLNVVDINALATIHGDR